MWKKIKNFDKVRQISMMQTQCIRSKQELVQPREWIVRVIHNMKAMTLKLGTKKKC